MESGPVPEADVTVLGIGLPLVWFTSTTCDPAGRFSYCAEIECPEMDWKLMIGEAISKPYIPELIFSPTPSGLAGSSIGQEKCGRPDCPSLMQPCCTKSSSNFQISTSPGILLTV